ncbi:drug/metabolite transporter (DMT)-like permease [Pseudomonas sp. BIGb0408]|uniref:Drug/metabolite transporter (DMT)-like permease n=1 Tax=Phytopseudomonas flavescens TaxID=29435 RepID=A0A7Z0BPM7_9GAMM|nr:MULTISPECIES: DMT family transporter [Pseudomonas]MCW2291339.1 drug/metabolite transporter (DMT)-like permease [Pseudomonas sp. BIGb0408]NYH74090.1 drug/metabolite transporter (DMT)-like permease [Pseudomonas flavescens]
MPNQALRADLLMLLTAMIWGSSFVAQRLGMDAIGPFLYSGLRFALAVVVLLPLLMLLRRRSKQPASPLSRPLLLGGCLMGAVLALGINLQQVGLLFTSVTNSGFITGLYVIVVPLLGLMLGHKTGMGIWLGASLAVVGMFLLSVGDGFQVASGDWLQLAGAFVWGVHVLLVGFFATRHDALLLALVQFVTCALISLALALIFEDLPGADIAQAMPAILYGGIFGVAVGFTLQVVAQRHAIASHAAIILSLEAVFAAIAGALLLGESLSARGYFGCALMFGGMLLAQLWPKPSASVIAERP